MDDAELWALARGALGSATPLRLKALQPFLDETGLDGSTFVLLMLVFSQEPETAAVIELRKLSPYTSMNRFAALLGGAMEAGLLQEPEPGTYRLTKRGQELVKAVSTRSEAMIAELAVLDRGDAERLLALLTRVVDTAVAIPTPREPWFTVQARRLLQVDADPVAAVVGCLACLDAYRSDAHAAAWVSTELEPVAAEEMTVLWRESAMPFTALMERLEGRGHRRGHSHDEYRAGLHELRQRSLVEGPDDALQLSGKGRELREMVEEETDRRFHAAWGCLDAEERAELAGLLSRLSERLQT